jgi:hypothetical protein
MEQCRTAIKHSLKRHLPNLTTHKFNIRNRAGQMQQSCSGIIINKFRFSFFISVSPSSPPPSHLSYLTTHSVQQGIYCLLPPHKSHLDNSWRTKKTPIHPNFHTNHPKCKTKSHLTTQRNAYLSSMPNRPIHLINPSRDSIKSSIHLESRHPAIYAFANEKKYFLSNTFVRS